jgi:hypothetical protein
LFYLCSPFGLRYMGAAQGFELFPLNQGQKAGKSGIFKRV